MSEADENGHGGARSGAGRPRGSTNRRTEMLRERIEAEGVDPAVALVRIAKDAEGREDYGLAVEAYGKVIPYIYARPKSQVIDVDAAVDLEYRIVRARLDAVAKAAGEDLGLAERLERAMRRAAACAALEAAENPLMLDAAPTVEHRPSPASQAAPAPKPAASAPPVAPAPFVDYYRPVLPRSSSSGVDFVECEYDATAGSYDLP